jgi:glutathione S-transferase
VAAKITSSNVNPRLFKGTCRDSLAGGCFCLLDLRFFWFWRLAKAGLTADGMDFRAGLPGDGNF